MGVSSSQLQPQELITFKKLSSDVPLENIEIPERPENRQPTNVKWLIIFGVFVVFLLPFMIYVLCNADIARIFIGYDNCGNTCGKKNSQWENIPCSGKDYRDSPLIEHEEYDSTEYKIYGRSLLMDRKCVQSCRKGYKAILGRCLKFRRPEPESNSGRDVSREEFKPEDLDMGIYFDSAKWHIAISCLLSILVSLGMLFLFRYAVAFVVWGILLGSLIGLGILVAAFWFFFNTADYGTAEDTRNGRGVTLVIGIVLSLVVVGLAVLLIWCRKKVGLVILLLKETTKAVFQMPGLIIVPLICSLVLLLITGLFILTSLYMQSAGTLEQVADNFYIYVQTGLFKFTLYYNLVVYLWISQFFTGIQYMIVAGAVSKWYFTRDKNDLGSPILNSMKVAFRFHLGTVALGALLITLIQIIKSIIMSLVKNEKVKILVQACIESIENFFKFLSKNAYIITAMHGQAFLKSGKRAAKLIIQNIADIIAVNFIGDFVLGMAKILIVVITLLLSAAIFALAPTPGQMANIPGYVVIGVFATIAACVTFGVFETTIDTIFICYCEDSLLNDGMAKPYFMSRNLMEFVQESKQIYGKK